MIHKLKNLYHRVLRLSERWLKTDMKYLASGGSWLTFGQAFTAASGLVLAWAFANFIPKEAYGNYKYILSLAGILSLFTINGMDTAVTQATARGLSGSFITGLKAKFSWAFLGSVVAAIGALYYIIQGNNVLGSSLFVVAAFLPFMDPLGLYNAVLNGKKVFHEAVILSVITKFVAAAALIGCTMTTDNVFYVVFTYFASHSLLRLFSTIYTAKRYVDSAAVDPGTVKYGKHLTAMNVLAMVADYLDQFIIFHFLGATSVAVYTIAIAPPEQLKAMFKNVNILLLPKQSGRSKKEIMKTLHHKMFIGLLITGAISIAYIVAAPFLFDVFFPAYTDAVIYSQLLAFSLITIIVVFPTTALQALQAQRQLYIYKTSISIVQIAFLVIGTITWGLMGAIVARIGYRVFGAIVAYYLLITVPEKAE